MCWALTHVKFSGVFEKNPVESSGDLVEFYKFGIDKLGMYSRVLYT